MAPGGTVVQWCHGWLIKKRETRLRRKGLLPRPVQESVATFAQWSIRKTEMVAKMIEQLALVKRKAVGIQEFSQ
jgi:hypothetical protein